MQWDWVELPDPPAQWGHGAHAHLLVGALPHSGKWRAVLAESEDQAHLVEALHAVSARLGGLPRRWRFDRMATVASPNTGRVTATFAAVAKHYGVGVDLCPPRHGNRKGTVEKANHSAAQRWWRTLPDERTVVEAQVSLDGFCARIGDGRARRRDGVATTVGALAATEPLAPLPPAFPATVAVERTVTAQALVAFRGNTYSVPPGLAGAKVTVSHRLAAMVIDIATSDGTVLARHRRELDGAGVAVRDRVHVAALQTAVLAAFDTSKPCPRKVRRPPSPAAFAAAAHLPTGHHALGHDTLRPGAATERVVVVDLAVWAAAARDRQVAP